VLAERGHRRADVIVSGLPWAAFSPDQQDELLNAVTDALTPDGPSRRSPTRSRSEQPLLQLGDVRHTSKS
jgi:phospholipid N-methyltransferase